MDLNQQNVTISYGWFKDAVKQNADCAALFIFKKNLINYTDPLGNTPLIYSLKEKRDTLALDLIQETVDLDAVDHSGLSALAIASYFNEPAALLILKHNVNVNSGTRVQCKPLFLACKEYHISLAVALIEKGANPSIASESCIERIAATGIEMHSETVTRAVMNIPTGHQARTAILNAIFKYDDHAIEFLLLMGADLEIQDILGYNALKAAIVVRDPKLAKKLVEKTKNLNATDRLGQNALNLAASHMPKVAMLLLEKGVNPNAGSYHEKRPLNKAIKEEFWLLAFKLIEHGARLDSLNDNEKYFLLLKALEKQHKPTINLLLNSTNQKYGRTFLMISMSRRSASSAKAILKANPDVDLVDEQGYCALDYALSLENEKLINLILPKMHQPSLITGEIANELVERHKSQFKQLFSNTAGYDNLNPIVLDSFLYFAVEAGEISKAEELLRKGANPFVDFESSSSFKLAIAKKWTRLVTLMIELNTVNVPESEICSICLDPMKTAADGSITKLKCAHFYHTTCLLDMVQHGNSKCALCRSSIKS